MGRRRRQHAGPALGPGFEDPVSPTELPGNRFPATIETWQPAQGETYLFVADYTADADSLNGRIATWTVDRHAAEVLDHDTCGSFGHDAGEFWLPSDVVVGPEATYIADRSNDRIQYDAGSGWETVGTAGYGDDSGRFLLPTSLALADGYLFVVDLVNRAVKVFGTRPDGGIPSSPVDAFGTFGGMTAGGDLWFPAMASAVPTGDGVTVFLPDSVLNVVYRFDWTPPEA